MVQQKVFHRQIQTAQKKVRAFSTFSHAHQYFVILQFSRIWIVFVWLATPNKCGSYEKYVTPTIGLH